MDTWLKMFSPLMDVRLPASGDVCMDYKPWTNWGKVSSKAGIPEMELEVFRDVALPGRQLGKLMEAVVLLIDLAEHSQAYEAAGESDRERKEFRELRALADEIEKKKAELKVAAEVEAKRALERLARTNEDYRASVEQLCKAIDQEKEKSQGES